MDADFVGRAGKEGDIASVVLWLCSRAGTYVNGQVIHVDGGLFLISRISKPANPCRASPRITRYNVENHDCIIAALTYSIPNSFIHHGINRPLDIH